MKTEAETNATAAKRLLNVYNTVVNLFWTALSFVPAIVFCYHFVSSRQLIFLCIPTVFSLLLPRFFFDRLQVSKSTTFYKKIGIGLINKFSQNGRFVYRFVEKRFPNYKAVTNRPDAIKNLLSQSFVYEKFHFMAAVFFVLLTLFALYRQHFWWAAIFMAINVFYNVYPILLQQYIRLKLQLFRQKKTSVNMDSAKQKTCRMVLHKTI